MKYIIVLIAFTACGYAQYPRLKIDSHGRIVSYYANSNRYEQTKVDTVPYKDTVMNYSSLGFNDYEGVSVSRTIYENGDTVIIVVGDSLTAIKNLLNSWQETLNSIPRTGTFKYTPLNDTVAIYRYPITDSSKYYWKKQVYWENKMNAELSRLDRTGHKNDISKALVRYQDSAIRYKLLLQKLKK